jgi:lysophospholipase L1-like esterase
MRQVAQGERVSAASQVQSTPRTVSGATPAPGRAPATGTARHRRIPGWQVTAIGDSVMLASAVQLQKMLPGIYIDAQVSRQMGAGVADVKILADRGRLRQVVVVGLGTNGTVTDSQIRQLVREIGPRRTLVLVNTYEARPWEHADNGVLAAAGRRYPNVVLADWLATIGHHRSLLWGDGVHPRPPGARLYARMLVAAIEGNRPAHNAAPAVGSPQVPGGLRLRAG